MISRRPLAVIFVLVLLTAAGGGRLLALDHPTAAASTSARSSNGQLGRIDYVVDGDTVDLVGGARVRLVQIDTPEVYPSAECFGKQASAAAKRLLPPGTLVRLTVESATDKVDNYGRLLRYLVRSRDSLNVNVWLVRKGYGAPYFYSGRRGRYAALLDRLARSARAHKLGLWGACSGTPYDPNHGVSTGRSH